MNDGITSTRTPRQRRNMGTGQASVRAQAGNMEAFHFVVAHGGNHSELYNRALAAFYAIEQARTSGKPIVQARIEIPLNLLTSFAIGDRDAANQIAQHIAEQLGMVGRGEIIPAKE